MYFKSKFRKVVAGTRKCLAICHAPAMELLFMVNIIQEVRLSSMKLCRRCNSSKFVVMDRVTAQRSFSRTDIRVIIKYSMLLDKQPMEIHGDLDRALSDNAPSIQTVRKWAAAFQEGRENVDDEERCGRPLTACSGDNVELVRGIIADDRRLTCEELSEMTALSPANYYSYKFVLQEKLRPAIRRKRPGLVNHVILHHDNAPVHTARQVTALLQFWGWEIIFHPPYSPDLAPCDFHIFPRMKESLRGRRFNSPEEIHTAAKSSIQHLDAQVFNDDFQAWSKRWEKCIELEGPHE